MMRAIVALGLVAAGVLILLAAYSAGAAVAAQDQFDRGMKAGVEYQMWFCENEVTPFAP